MAPTIKIAVSGSDEFDLDKLEALQGDLKRLDRAEYEKLRKTLTEDGLSLVLHVWKNNGKVFLIDGHQRVAAMKIMRDTEGYKIPKIPCSIVKAKDLKDARRKVLLAISQHGKLTDKSLHTYLTENGIAYEELASTFSLPGIDVGKFMTKFADVDLVPKIEIAPATMDMKHGSDNVRQVQLFFDGRDHEEFMQKIEAVSQNLKIENISDALLVVLREAYNDIQAK